jgi:hypothetical protein
MVYEFGHNKVAYRVNIKKGYIEVQVLHENKGVRKLIEDNMRSPKKLLEICEAHPVDNPRAKYWLGQLIEYFRPYFITESVDFIL